MGDIALKQPGVESAVAFPGPVDQRLHQQLERRASCSSTLKPFDERKARRPERRRDRRPAQPEVRRRSRTPSSPCSRRRRCRASAPSAASSCRSRTAPALGYEALDDATKAFMAKALRRRRSSPALFSSYQVNVPQLYADIDRTKARQLGVPVTDVFDTHADLSRLALRQRLQQVRPHLLGARAGRRAVPRPRRRHRAAEGALRPPARWCRCRRC